MTTAIMQNDMRIGVQIIIEGERMEITELLVLFTLFLKLAIPALVALQTFADPLISIVGSIKGAWVGLPKIDFTPIGKQDFLIIYLGLCLAGILIGVMIKND